jgi:hypothetical protein
VPSGTGSALAPIQKLMMSVSLQGRKSSSTWHTRRQ